MSRPVDLYGRPWAEREYIVVLHYYFQNRHQPRHHLCDYVKEVASLIGRTPGSVVMRMENYASIDPDVVPRRTGLVNISVLGKKVFTDWHRDTQSLRACAEVLIREIRSALQPTLFDPDPVRMPQAFGKYELLDEIGQGGFGAVYSCIHSETNQSFALKVIKTDSAADTEVVARFRREIRALKAVRHPNIITIHEDNLEDTPHFPAFVMDLAVCSLVDYVKDKLTGIRIHNGRPVLPLEEAWLILRSIIDGVEALHNHSHPVIHRDIKPHNLLLLPDGKWVLADFGLAKFMPHAAVTATFVTASLQGFGTDGFSAPEQFQDFHLTDERADIYGLGVLIWYLFSSSLPPFDRTDSGLPQELEAVFLRATERKRERRQASVTEFRQGVGIAFDRMGSLSHIA